MRTDYPHIQITLDTITPISAVLLGSGIGVLSPISRDIRRLLAIRVRRIGQSIFVGFK